MEKIAKVEEDFFRTLVFENHGWSKDTERTSGAVAGPDDEYRRRPGIEPTAGSR